jgi:hemoglobin
MGQAIEDPTIEQTPAADGEALTDRRDVLLRGAMLSAAAVAVPFAAGCSRAAEQAEAADRQPAQASGESLYDRLGGIFAIAGVVDYFSDEIIKDPTAGAQSRNPALRKWHTESLDRLPGLKFMRTLWVANVAGGPYQYTPTRPGSTNLGLENAHKDLHISSAEFDAVAAVLSRSLDHFEVPEKEKGEVLAAFAAHKDEVTRGSRGA